MSSPTGGVKPMAIGGRMVRERERAIGMTEEERAWRKQYLKDMELHHGPKHVPALENEFTHPIRRIYRAPLDGLYNVLKPTIGHERAWSLRFWTGKVALFGAFFYSTYYYFKYNQNDWTRKGGWRVIDSRKACVPGDEGFPKLSERSQPGDYADRGFKKSPI